MFCGTGDQVAACALGASRKHHTAQSHIIAFGTAACKNNLAGVGVHEFGDGTARLIEGAAGLTAVIVR
jgi:hypothetical protein